MIGYCQNCKKNVEMEGVETMQLPDLSFIQSGYHIAGRVKHTIWKKVQDTELIVLDGGRRIPDVVFASRKTPKNIYSISVGQKVVSREKYIKDIKPKKDKKRTLDDVKRKVLHEKKKSIDSLRD